MSSEKRPDAHAQRVEDARKIIAAMAAIYTAVEIAQELGVSREDFLRLVRSSWKSVKEMGM